MSFNVICQEHDRLRRVYCLTAHEALRESADALGRGCEALRIVSTNGSIVSVEHLEALAKAERFESAMYGRNRFRPDDQLARTG